MGVMGDYLVQIDRILVLLYEAKSEDMNKGVVQVLAQIYSIIKRQCKCKLDQTISTIPIIFGIVTTGKLWQFVHWTGLLE